MQTDLQPITISQGFQTIVDEILILIKSIESDNSPLIELNMLKKFASEIGYARKWIRVTTVKFHLIDSSILEEISDTLNTIFTELTNYNLNKDPNNLNTTSIKIENLNKLLKRVNTIIYGVEEEIDEFYERSLEEISQTRIDSLILDMQDKFLISQSQRTEQFENIIQNFKQEHIKKIDSENTNFMNEYKTKTIDKYDEIQQMNKQAEEILGAIGMKAHAEGYRRIANGEGQKALFWNLLSITSLVGILWFGFEFIIQHKGELTWTALVSRALLTGVGLTLFTYCAKQGTNHRNEEKRNRKIELELATLTPYLQDLDPVQQREVKQSLVSKYFGVEIPQPQQQAQANNVVTDLTKNPQVMQTLAQKVVEFLPSGK